jgi:ATP:corrinoid adenosyltransferase
VHPKWSTPHRFGLGCTTRRRDAGEGGSYHLDAAIDAYIHRDAPSEWAEGEIWMRHNAAWDAARSPAHETSLEPTFSIVVLDQPNIMLYCDALPVSEVISVLRGRQPQTLRAVAGNDVKFEPTGDSLAATVACVRNPFRDHAGARIGYEC